MILQNKGYVRGELWSSAVCAKCDQCLTKMKTTQNLRFQTPRALSAKRKGRLYGELRGIGSQDGGTAAEHKK